MIVGNTPLFHNALIKPRNSFEIPLLKRNPRSKAPIKSVFLVRLQKPLF